MNSPQATVFVVDDDETMRESLAAFVQSMGLRVSCHASSEAFLRQYDTSRPGCLIADFKMPGMNGIELQETLLARGIHLPVIMMTGYGDVSSCAHAMKQGAVDFLEKPYQTRQLRSRILEAIEGDFQRREQETRAKRVTDLLARLTPDEVRVAEMIVDGLTNKAIAARLDVSLRTVQLRRSSLKKKLKIDSVPELVNVMRMKVASPPR